MPDSITYPVFVKDTDGEMALFWSKEYFVASIEAVTIEDGEYTAWDLTGQPLELFVTDGYANLKATGETPRLGELLREVINYGARCREAVFEPPPDVTDPVRVYYLADEFLRLHRPPMFRRLRKLFS